MTTEKQDTVGSDPGVPSVRNVRDDMLHAAVGSVMGFAVWPASR